MNRMRKRLLLTSALVVSSLSLGAAVQAAPQSSHSFTDALKNGTVLFDARYRFENVDDASVAQDGEASTLRTRLGYETAMYKGFSGLLELSHTAVLGNERFNDTLNGNTTRAVIPDPEGAAVNRAMLQYHNLHDTVITVGRQTLTLDNERFVTNGNFRQKQKTFDQLHVVSNAIRHLTVNYAYMWGTNDNTSSAQGAGGFDTSNHLINLSTDAIPHVRLAGYGYLLDFDDVPANSLDTYGIHFDGSYALNARTNLLYQGDWATQSEADNNTANIDLNFLFLEPGIQFEDFTVKFGYLNFEGDGTNGFQTPIGDAHPYSGWADVFGATPANGLEEYYGKFSYSHKSGNKYIDTIGVVAEYHTFEAENASTDYGDEWDLGVYTTFGGHYTASLEYASFSADSGSSLSDIDKLWVTLGVSF